MGQRTGTRNLGRSCATPSHGSSAQAKSCRWDVRASFGALAPPSIRVPGFGTDVRRSDTVRFYRPHATAHAQCREQCCHLQQCDGDQRLSETTGIEDGPEHERRQCLPGVQT